MKVDERWKDLSTLVTEVKKEIRKASRKKANAEDRFRVQIRRLGDGIKALRIYEKDGEIGEVMVRLLQEEIDDHIISKDSIYRHCLPSWKRTEKEKRMDDEERDIEIKKYWKRILAADNNGFIMIKSTLELINTLTNNGREFTQAVIDESRDYRLQGMKQCGTFDLNRILNGINFLSVIFEDMRPMIRRELETKKETDTLHTP